MALRMRQRRAVEPLSLMLPRAANLAAGRHIEGEAGDFGGENGVVIDLMHAAFLSFVSKFAALGNRAQALDPHLRIAFGLIQIGGAGEFGGSNGLLLENDKAVGEVSGFVMAFPRKIFTAAILRPASTLNALATFPAFRYVHGVTTSSDRAVARNLQYLGRSPTTDH